MISYGLLSVKNFPFLDSFLEKLSTKKCLPKIIIFDEQMLSNLEIERYCQRTGENYKNIKFYEENKYKIFQFEVQNHNAGTSKKIIKENNLDFLVNLGTPRILKEEIINSTTLGILNCHPGLLPDFRGCSCVEWAILNDKPVGNTLHWMDVGIDSGPIISKLETQCYIHDNYQNIRKRVYEDGATFLSELVDNFVKSSLNLIKENFRGKIYQGGNYFKPMDENTLREVINKIEKKHYKFQKKRF